MKSSSEIRNIFLRFFEQKLHQIVKSAPIVVKDDPTLMFTNAGMNQFKDIFLGIKNPDFQRAADTQKCLRVSGKHNDLEEVGHDTYHHTMFEMLGNWSFGDYYKAESIEWAWELLTKHYEMDPNRLYATVFAGDEKDGLDSDEEAVKEWLKWLPREQILHCGKKDNFWEMGAVGPAGPCSEIHVDLRTDAERAAVDGSNLVNQDHPEVIEIWNLVFIQYNRLADGSLQELPSKHIDTGMGFERLVMALQGKHSSYDSDLFDRTRAFLEAKTGLTYSSATEAEQIAFRVIMDHIRAITFAIADGEIPANDGSGYVIRRVLRRAVRYGFSYLGLNEPFLYEMIPLLSAQYSEVFEEVGQQQDFIQRVVQAEEQSFLRTLDKGIKLFETYLENHPDQSVVAGDFAFRLKDTYGFPIDLTEVMAKEKGLTVEMDRYEELLAGQKAQSKTDRTTEDWVIVSDSLDLPRFLGYDTLALETQLLQYREVHIKDHAKGKKDKKGKETERVEYEIVLAETPFYAESGGQVGDRGTIRNGAESIEVLTTKKENQLIIHQVDHLPTDASGSWQVAVNPEFRRLVRANHSATHLLHAALRHFLGDHVEQRGSLVSDQVLRFDFSHFKKVSAEQLAQIEEMVNAKIRENIPLTEYREIPIAQAKAMGAMALFGEKYGDLVRTIVFDPAFSIELCGGTHVANTQEIRLFKLISESSISAGVRRIEAYTSDGALAYLNERSDTLDRVANLLKQPADLEKAIEELNTKTRSLEKQLEQLNGEKIVQLRDQLLEQAEQRADLKLIRAQVNLASANDLKQLSFELRKNSQNTLVVLGAVINDKPMLSVIQSEDLAESNRFDAGKMIRSLAKEIQGGGGGQPFYATAGGKNPAGLPKALEAVEGLLA